MATNDNLAQRPPPAAFWVWYDVDPVTLQPAAQTFPPGRYERLDEASWRTLCAAERHVKSYGDALIAHARCTGCNAAADDAANPLYLCPTQPGFDVCTACVMRIVSTRGFDIGFPGHGDGCSFSRLVEAGRDNDCVTRARATCDAAAVAYVAELREREAAQEARRQAQIEESFRVMADAAAANKARQKAQRAQRLRMVATLAAMGHTCVRLTPGIPDAAWCMCLSHCTGRPLEPYEIGGMATESCLAADLGALGHVCMAIVAERLAQLTGRPVEDGASLRGWCGEIGFCAQIAAGWLGSRTAPWVGEPMPASDGDTASAAVPAPATAAAVETPPADDASAAQACPAEFTPACMLM